MYRHVGNGLLRAARAAQSIMPEQWPDLTGDATVDSWRSWLLGVWSGSTADAITLASPSLAQRVEQVCAGKPVRATDIRRAVIAVVRYLLREVGRPTPF